MDEAHKYCTRPRGERMINWGQPEASALFRVLSPAIELGQHMVHGIASDHYFSLSQLYNNSPICCDELPFFHDLLIAWIEEVVAREQISQIGLIIRQDGSAGIEQEGGLLAANGLSFFQVRLGQRLWAKALRPDVACKIREEKPRILLLVDAALSGAGIYEAAMIIRRSWEGLNLGFYETPEITAFAIYDYLRGAREKLNMKRIQFYSLTDYLFFYDGRLLPDNPVMRKCAPRILFESAAAKGFL